MAAASRTMRRDAVSPPPSSFSQLRCCIPTMAATGASRGEANSLAREAIPWQLICSGAITFARQSNRTRAWFASRFTVKGQHKLSIVSETYNMTFKRSLLPSLPRLGAVFRPSGHLHISSVLHRRATPRKLFENTCPHGDCRGWSGAK